MRLKHELAKVKRERDFFELSGSILREGIEMKYRMLERCHDAFPLRMMCRCLKVSPSGYYEWRDRPLSARAQANEVLLRQTKELHENSDGVAGAPRIWEDLQYAGVTCGKNRIARLMQAHGIQGIPQRKRGRKKPPGERPVGIRDHLARDFSASEPNTKWVTDITYIETAEGWVYLSAVLDLHSGLLAAGR